MKDNLKISVVIPALNEEKGIGAVIKQIPVKEFETLGYSVEIIVVDNGSTDGTAHIAEAHGARVISQPIRGYGHAYRAGFDSATGHIIATGDADMTYPFDHLPDIVSVMIEEGIHFLNTDRLSNITSEAMTQFHIFGNKVLSQLTSILFKWPFRDSQSGMWIFKRDIWQHLDVRSGGMPFSQELKIEAYTKGFVCDEIPIEYRARTGNAKLTLKDAWGNVTQLFTKRFGFASKKNLVKN